MSNNNNFEPLNIFEPLPEDMFPNYDKGYDWPYGPGTPTEYDYGKVETPVIPPIITNTPTVQESGKSNLKDSGTRELYETGAVRDNGEGKGRFDLMPFQGMMRLARHYENGAKKYKDRNWEKGMNISRYVDAAMRHLYKYLDGWNDEDHLSAAAWNLFAIMHHEAELPEMQDLPKWKDKKSNFIVERED